ncbi:MAG: hypothetical protein JJU29_05560 [Verrucomicrobia bacterium]|nr:hypothetical protein [Verrucomicrobiota bacterium]MCH8512686.1 hypothetical protein [Kiritimatiellia bacterium]
MSAYPTSPPISAGMRSVRPTTLTKLELDELHRSEPWAAASSKAEKILENRFSLYTRCHKVTIQELSLIPSSVIRLRKTLSLRGLLEDFIRFQEEEGQVPDVVEKGMDSNGPRDITGSPTMIRSARRIRGGVDQEASLVIAVSNYVHHSGDLRFLSESIHGKNVSKHLSDAMEYVWTTHQSGAKGLKGLLLPGRGGAEAGGIAGIRETAWFLCAIHEMLGLPVEPGFPQGIWRQRQAELAAILHKSLLGEVKGNPLSQTVGAGCLETNGGMAFDPLGTALAIRAGVLNPEETERSLRATLALLEGNGGSVGWSAQVAAIYAKAGYQVHAMEMLRTLAACPWDGEGGENAPLDGPYSPYAPPLHVIAACFLQGMKNLHPMVMVRHATPPPREVPPPLPLSPKPSPVQSPGPTSAPAPPAATFGHPNPRKFSFKKIEFQEKRENKRAPIQLPVDVEVKGFRQRLKASGSIWHPSSCGLRLILTESISEGATLEMIAHSEALGDPKPCRLRGRVAWSRSKVGTRLYHCGVELDARSKDLKKWNTFVTNHLLMQEK